MGYRGSGFRGIGLLEGPIPLLIPLVPCLLRLLERPIPLLIPLVPCLLRLRGLGLGIRLLWGLGSRSRASVAVSLQTLPPGAVGKLQEAAGAPPARRSARAFAVAAAA